MVDCVLPDYAGWARGCRFVARVACSDAECLADANMCIVTEAGMMAPVLHKMGFLQG